MKKIYCIISAFSKNPTFEFDYEKLQETANKQSYEFEFLTIAPQNVLLSNTIGEVKTFPNYYSHNQAMSEIIPTLAENLDGMIVIDCMYASDYPLISSMLQEFRHGANIVHVRRKKRGYLDKLFEYSLSFFNKLNQALTGSHDKGYVRTLHIVDKSTITLLKYFPTKYGLFCEADFLGNCKTAVVLLNNEYKLAKQRKTNIFKIILAIFMMLAGVAGFVLAVTLTLGLDFILWMLIAFITLTIGGGTFLCYAIIDDKIRSTPKLVKQSNTSDTIGYEENKNEDVETTEKSISETEETINKTEEFTSNDNANEVEIVQENNSPNEVEVVEPIVEEKVNVNKTNTVKKTSTTKKNGAKKNTSKKQTKKNNNKKTK